MNQRKKNTVSFRGIRPGSPGGRLGLHNPERGLRFEIGIARLPEDPVKFTHVRKQWPFEEYRSDGVSIAQAYCYLTQFHDRPISAEKLDALEADFQKLRSSGNKFLLRFAYEFEGYPFGPTQERILAHMEQLKPLLDRNWDVIYVLQAGWIGLWGEFHTSVQKLESPEIASKIIDGTLRLLPKNRFTMMRRGQYKINILNSLGRFEEITPEIAFSERAAAKIGFFNDGTLAGHNDGFTFPDAPFFSGKGNPEFDYINREAPFMPVDGELFWTNQLGDPGDPSGLKTIERFRLQHYSTFSYVHGFSGLDVNPHEFVIDHWKTEMLQAEQLKALGYSFAEDYFDGEKRSAFEFIRDHLGYRLDAQKAVFDAETAPGAPFEAELELINRGFATMINPREFFFVLFNESGDVLELPTGFNGQMLQPYAPGDESYTPLRHTLRGSAVLPATAAKGEWTLALWMPDESESLRYRSDYAVRLANELPFVELAGRGLNLLGKVLLK